MMAGPVAAKSKPKRFEGSPADKAEDKRGAKKAGVSVKAWEGSPSDKRADAAGQRKLNAAAKRKKAKG